MIWDFEGTGCVSVLAIVLGLGLLGACLALGVVELALLVARWVMEAS